MDKKLKYCSVFLLLTVLTILAISTASAVQADADDTGIIDNTITTTASDSINTVTQADNNIKESQTIQKEAETSNKDTTATSSNKKLMKDDKNLKAGVTTGTLTLTPNSGKAGNSISISLKGGATSYGSSGESHIFVVKLNGTTIINGNTYPTISSRVATTTMIVPEYEPGTYTMEVTIGTSSNWAARGTANFTIESYIPTKITELGTITGEIGKTIIPVTVTDLDGNAISGTSTLTFKNGNDTLLDNVTIVNGSATVSVPTNKVGTYPITVIFNRNDLYQNSSTNVTINVSKANAILTVDGAEPTFYKSINVLYNTLATGNLKTSNNVSITNENVSVNINGEDYVATTDDQGNFVFIFNVTQLASNVPITFNYYDNELYNAAQEISGTFDIVALDTSITLDEVTLSEVNETTTISGTVTDNDDNPVPNADVNIYIANLDQTNKVRTDDEGKFSYDVIFSDVLEVEVSASLDNQELYNSQPASTTFDVIVGPRRTNLTITEGNIIGNTISIEGITPYFNELILRGTLIDIFDEPAADSMITILINNQDYSCTTDENGIFELVYNATEGLTVYNISVEFEGNSLYKPAGEVYTGTFKTDAFDIKLTMDDNFPEEMLIGDVITISGSATLQNNPLRNNPIVLTIDGTKYNTSTNDEGIYSYDYTIQRNGTIQIMANATFSNANIILANANIFVNKPSVTIELNEIEDALRLDPIEISGRIYIDSNGTAIQDDLTLKVNNQTITVATDAQGNYNHTFNPQSAGVYAVSVSYGNVRYAVKDAETTFTVNRRNTLLVNDEVPLAVNQLDVVTISGSLIDETDAYISNAEIIFKINGETYTNVTDENGRYCYNYEATTVQDNVLYEVRYSGDNTYDLARNYVGSFFDVEPRIAIIVLNTEDSFVNKMTTISGQVVGNRGEMVVNKTVKLLINDDEYLITTDENGIFTCKINATKVGDNTVVASLVDDVYTSTNVTKNFFVVETYTVINPVYTKANIPTTITINVTSNKELSIVNEGKVVVKVNGKTVKDENKKIVYAKVSDGKATVNYTFTSAQIVNNANITATYSGSTNFPGSHGEAISVQENTTRFVTITLNDITAVAGQTITINSDLEFENNPVDSGKVLYKVNGKTIRDATTNKVLYAIVSQGSASSTYTIPATMKVGNYTLEAVYTGASYDKTQAEAVLHIVKDTDNTQTGNNVLGISNRGGAIKSDGATTHVITNDNVDEYITANGLTSLVSPGDTLDIQGTIDRQHSLIINKPINIISSTQDAVINLHTVSGGLTGSNPGNLFEINNAASGSNISSLYLYNTQLWLYNTYDVTLYNMTMYVINQTVGGGVGQTAIRYSERITIDSCFIYTQNNGGSSSMALTGSSDVLFRNTTIQGVQGEVGPNKGIGNILYLGNTYNTNDKPSGFTMRNTNITLEGCTLLGECVQSITELIKNFATNCSFINNTFNTTDNYGHFDTAVGGVAIGNKFYQTADLSAKANSTVYGNVFYGTGKTTPYAGANIYNNTLATIEISTNANIYNNTIANVVMYANTELSNNIITGNVNINGQTVRAAVSNVKITNNTIYGNIISTGYTSSKKNTNNIIANNSIGGNITLTQTDTHTIENNRINGTITVANTATNTVITNNTIVTNNQYTVSNAIASTTITNNLLVSNNLTTIGDSTIRDTTGRATIQNNGPDTTKFIDIVYDDISGIVGESIDMSIKVTDVLSRGTDGTVNFIVNDELLVDENGIAVTLIVSNDQTTLEDFVIPTSWLRSDMDLSILYISDYDNEVLNVGLNITKRTADVEVLNTYSVSHIGDTITLQARITDGNELVDSGRVAFKLGSNSLFDSEHNLIWVDVVEGMATLEYTLDTHIVPSTYELVAVFENSLYQRSAGSSEITIE